MEERKPPPVQRGNIDGIRPRRPSVDVENQITGNAQAGDGSQEVSDQKPKQSRQAEKQADKKPKAGKNLSVIIPAVIIFIGLSALAIYVGIQKNLDGRQAEKTGSAQTNSADTSGSIDQVINEIDQLSDQPDNSGEGLSDEKLGL
ncbi:MAG: hypothetical protein WD885_01700 [Candidatus Saccharimonadales bacterium]